MKTATSPAFTLVEIMIVVAIIGMLAMIAIPNFVKARETAQKNACINNLRQIDGAKQSWALEARTAGNAIPGKEDLKPYIGRAGNIDAVHCPADRNGTFDTSYEIREITVPPTCKPNDSGQVTGHVLL
ncbi:MAG: prepilin-type N-terminal cleavage/methylation domain-containing protein [Verrucomicrobiales bacterium]|nr:prepilin-type N-terminal cleavage/methylation domain-containing protein [Verrucomicrobiales bacterium]